MRDLRQIHRVERAKWDEQAQREINSLGVLHDPDFQSYAAHATTMRGIAAFLGDLRGKRVLEMGCGLGHIAVLLARSGAKVTAFDISPISVLAASRRACINGVEEGLDLVVAAGEELPFADESFDVVFGKGVLHHLDVSVAAGELYRVLKPGGKAAFAEPMGMNPLLKFVRNYIPFRRRTRAGPTAH